jgi:hypothetical protein
MSLLTTIVEGWTGSLTFTLRADGDAVDITGLTVQIVLSDCHRRTVVDSSSGVTVTDSTAGTVEYAPSSSDFSARLSPYRVRFRLIDTSSKIVYFPNGDHDLIGVGAP